MSDLILYIFSTLGLHSFDAVLCINCNSESEEFSTFKVNREKSSICGIGALTRVNIQ